MRHQDVKTFSLYFLSGCLGLCAAVYLSTYFLKRGLAQTPPGVIGNQQLPPLPEAPSAKNNPPAIPQDPNLAIPSGPPAVPSSEGQTSETQKNSPTNGQPEATAKNLLEGIIEDFNYEVSGRRDPFMPYTSPKSISVSDEDEIISPLQRFDLDQLKLIGIIWDIKKPKAMFLDPAGKGYIVSKLDKVGRNRGYIAEIREGEVIILERYVGEGRSTFQTRSMRLERE